ncbi:Ig-like domain-containing protein [Paenibacillus sp. QZ-Y1]|uniref:Ig-like domain-containing protein n=1 Tax=Paenibacillus sp. QZ-Y1 TaxID=3414511 RepID=UPI003F7A73F8
MNKKVSIVVIMLLLITQLMQGWVFTANIYAEDMATEHTLTEPLSEDVGVEPVTDGGEATSTLDSEASSESAESIETNEQDETDTTADNMAAANAAAIEIKENLITAVQMYDQIPEYDGNGHITVKGNKIEDTRPSVKDEVAVVFKWGLANETHAYTDGSTFTFRLPDKFSIGSQLKGVLDGGVGDYIVNPDGEITFIFNDAIRGAKLEGNFYVWIKFDESKLEDGLKQQIDFGNVGQGSIPVHFANTAIDKLTKSGSANKNNFNSDEMVWCR